MINTVETVKVSDGAGSFFTINKGDFDPAVHAIFEEPAGVAEDTYKRSLLNTFNAAKLEGIAKEEFGLDFGDTKKTRAELIDAIMEAQETGGSKVKSEEAEEEAEEQAEEPAEEQAEEQADTEDEEKSEENN